MNYSLKEEGDGIVLMVQHGRLSFEEREDIFRKLHDIKEKRGRFYLVADVSNGTIPDAASRALMRREMHLLSNAIEHSAVVFGKNMVTRTVATLFSRLLPIPMSFYPSVDEAYEACRLVQEKRRAVV